MSRSDPACEPDEVVTVTTETTTETFRAGVLQDDERDCVRISPVPERVGVEMIGYGVRLAAESVEDGCYIWNDHHVTDFGTQIVSLSRYEKLDGELFDDGGSD